MRLDSEANLFGHSPVADVALRDGLGPPADEELQQLEGLGLEVERLFPSAELPRRGVEREVAESHQHGAPLKILWNPPGIPEDSPMPAAVLAVLGHQMPVPTLREGGYVKALQNAVQVARNDEYRAHRKALYEWQQRFVASGAVTDARSVRGAVEEMERLVARMRSAARQQGRWNGLKQFFAFFGVAFKFAALASPVMAAAGGASAALGSLRSTRRSRVVVSRMIPASRRRP